MNLISNYETWMDKLLPKILGESKTTVIDVGANVGQTLLKVLPLHQMTNYYAIEPNTYCATYIEDLVRKNTFPNVEVLQYALSDSTGEAELLLRYRDDILATTSSSFRKYTKYSSTLTVPKTTGDLLFNTRELENLSILKIDVEGGELNVLKGFYQTIKTHQPYLVIEILPLHSKDASVANFRLKNADGILALLRELKYDLYNIKQKIKVETVQDLSTSLESSNYIGLPQNKYLGNLLE